MLTKLVFNPASMAPRIFFILSAWLCIINGMSKKPLPICSNFFHLFLTVWVVWKAWVANHDILTIVLDQLLTQYTSIIFSPRCVYVQSYIAKDFSIN